MQKYFYFDFQMGNKIQNIITRTKRIMKGIKWFINAYILKTVATLSISRFMSRRDINGAFKKMLKVFFDEDNIRSYVKMFGAVILPFRDSFVYVNDI